MSSIDGGAPGIQQPATGMPSFKDAMKKAGSYILAPFTFFGKKVGWIPKDPRNTARLEATAVRGSRDSGQAQEITALQKLQASAPKGSKYVVRFNGEVIVMNSSDLSKLQKKYDKSHDKNNAEFYPITKQISDAQAEETLATNNLAAMKNYTEADWIKEITSQGASAKDAARFAKNETYIECRCEGMEHAGAMKEAVLEAMEDYTDIQWDEELRRNGMREKWPEGSLKKEAYIEARLNGDDHEAAMHHVNETQGRYEKEYARLIKMGHAEDDAQIRAENHALPSLLEDSDRLPFLDVGPLPDDDIF